MVLSRKQFAPTYETEHGSAKVTPSGYVFNVHVQDAHRGQGEGTRLMQQITNDADALGKPLALNAREELHPWYQRLGFEPIDDDMGATVFGNPTMRRQPRSG